MLYKIIILDLIIIDNSGTNLQFLSFHFIKKVVIGFLQFVQLHLLLLKPCGPFSSHFLGIFQTLERKKKKTSTILIVYYTWDDLPAQYSPVILYTRPSCAEVHSCYALPSHTFHPSFSNFSRVYKMSSCAGHSLTPGKTKHPNSTGCPDYRESSIHA